MTDTEDAPAGCPCGRTFGNLEQVLSALNAPAVMCPKCERKISAHELATLVRSMADAATDLHGDTPKKPSHSGADYEVRVRPTGAPYDVTVASESIDRHLEITGALPVVGEPLYAAPAGLPSWVCHVPVGVVTHVEKRATQSN